MSDYRNLFQGAARLGVVVGALDIPFTRTSGFVEAMSEELDAYQAMRVSADVPSLGLSTRGQGKGFVHRCARLMDDAGIEEEELRRFLVRAARFDHEGLEFRIDLLGAEGGGFAYRIRAAHDLDLAKAMLLDGGASGEGLHAVDEAARLAGRDRAQAFACQLDLAGGRRESVMLGRCAIDALQPVALRALQDLRGAEEIGDPWLSVGPDALELVVEDVPAGWAGERGEALVGVFGKERADRGHVRLTGGALEREVVCERTGAARRASATPEG